MTSINQGRAELSPARLPGEFVNCNDLFYRLKRGNHDLLAASDSRDREKLATARRRAAPPSRGAFFSSD